MADQNDELDGYFSIKEDKVTTLVKTTNQMYHIVAEMVRDSVIATKPSEWENGSTDALTVYYVILSALKSFLNDILLNPSKETLRLAKKHKVEGILIRGEDLLLLNTKLLESEQTAKALEVDHRIVFNIH
jgi:hypothetical protein